MQSDTKILTEDNRTSDFSGYFSAFPPNPEGHGGERWVHNIAQTFGVQAVPMRSLIGGKQRSLAAQSIELLAALLLHPQLFRLLLCVIAKPDGQKMTRRNRLRVILQATKFAAKLNRRCLYLFDLFIGSGPIFLRTLHLLDFRFSVCIHNIESLVPGQALDLVSAFSDEIRVLGFAESLFVTGALDHHILALFGLSAPILPLTIPSSRLSQLQEIRRQRNSSSRFDSYLMYGTYLNQPTAIGMNQVLSAYPQQAISLHVAGMATEKLSVLFSNARNIDILGYLSTEDFHAELLKAKAVIVWTPPTTGTLMKIAELREAGIPILCNMYAARGEILPEGSRVFQTSENLASFLRLET